MDITGIKEIDPIWGAVNYYKKALNDACGYVTWEQLHAGIRGDASEKAFSKYQEEVKNKVKRITDLLDKLLTSLDAVKNTYSTVDAAGATSLNTSSSNLKS